MPACLFKKDCMPKYSYNLIYTIIGALSPKTVLGNIVSTIYTLLNTTLENDNSLGGHNLLIKQHTNYLKYLKYESYTLT